VLATLQRDFVNVWLLAKDLDTIAERSDDPDVAKLCALIRENSDYPVDSVLITDDLRVVGHVNVHSDRARSAEGYLAFLREGLAHARGEQVVATKAAAATPKAANRGRPPVPLTPAQPSGTVLDTIRRGGLGENSMLFVIIDATAFEDGGELEIAVQVGTGAAAGRFELCAAVPERPGAMSPVETLDRIEPRTHGTLRYRFAEGARFGLAAMPAAGAVEGDLNAFLATVTVRPQ
jgi:hypothetical protein